MWQFIVSLQNGLTYTWHNLLLNWLLAICALTLGQTTLLKQHIVTLADLGTNQVIPWQVDAEIKTYWPGIADSVPFAPPPVTVTNEWQGEIKKGLVTFPFQGEARLVDHQWYLLLQTQPPLGEYDFRSVVGKWWRLGEATPEFDADRLLVMMEQVVEHADLAQLKINVVNDVIAVPFSIPAAELETVSPDCKGNQPLVGRLELSWQKMRWRKYDATWRCQLQRPVAGVPARTWLTITMTGVFERTRDIPKGVSLSNQPEQSSSAPVASSSGQPTVEVFPSWSSLRAAPPAELPIVVPEKTLR